MAAVHGPIMTHHSDPYNKGQNGNIPPNRSHFNPTPAQVAPSRSADHYYGHEQIARLCARYITHLFTCPDEPPVKSAATHTRLPHFIAYALHRTKLHVTVTFAALVILQRLKARFPTARGSSGHRLFLSAYMIASKVICDDTYSNKSWTIVGQNMFPLREVNQMEREMCGYLEWELNVEAGCLKSFEKMIRRDFAKAGPYPTYLLTTTANRITGVTSTLEAPVVPPGMSTSPIPSFGQHAPAKPPQPTINTASIPSYGSSTSSSPETPLSSYSNSTSPATTSSPPTPYGSVQMDNVKIIGEVYSPNWGLKQKVALQRQQAAAAKKLFAYAVPSGW